MAKDLAIVLEDRPGTAAEALESLGEAGINVEGACGVVVDGKAVAHFLVEDADAAKQALDRKGIRVESDRDAIVMAVEDTPGSGGKLLRRLAEAGVNIEAIYMATNTRVVICVSNPEAARQHLQSGVGAPETHT